MLEAPPDVRLAPEPRATRAHRQPAPLWLRMLGMDYRSLAFLRFGLGLTMFGDIWDRSNDLHAHYTDLAVTHHAHPFLFNIYLTTGTYTGVAFLFLIHSIFALCFAVGYRTKMMQVLCWLFHAGLMGRNIPIGHGGDMYLRCLLFWTMFLPLGKCWSVDNVLRERRRKPRSTTYFVNMATIAVLFQVIALYLFSYFLKTHDWWRKDYTAAYYALRLDFFRRPLGDLLLLFPDMLRLLTWATLWWEALGGAFYLIPIGLDYWRLFACVAYIGLHLGFGLTLRLGTFMWIGIVGQFGLIPGWFWDKIVFKYLRTPERAGLKVYYPAHCEQCGRAARALRTFFLIPGTEVAAAVASGEDYSKEELHTSIHPMSLNRANPTDDWVVVDHAGYSHYGFAALVEICARSPFLWLVPQSVLSALWSALFIVHPRHRPSETPAKPHRKTRHTNLSLFRKIFVRILVNIALLILLLLACGWNLHHMKVETPAQQYHDIGVRLGIDQYWGMFSPRPPDVDFWYTVEGNTSAGTMVELWRNGGFFSWQPNPVTFEKPEPVWYSFRNHRWFKFFEVYNQADREGMRLGLGRYICRQYNARHHDAKIHIYRVWAIEERHFLNGSAEIFSKVVLWEHKCW